VSEGAPVSFLEVRAAGVPFAIAAEHVERVERVPGDQRALVLSIDDERVTLAVDEIVGISSFAPADILPLPPLVRRAAPRFQALAVREGAKSLLVLDTRAVLPGKIAT
jgi:chemotaxis signal transduction protein